MRSRSTNDFAVAQPQGATFGENKLANLDLAV